MIDFDLRAADSQLLVVDMQERFLPAIPDMDVDAACGRACATLIAGCALLELPICFSEQVPDKLGPTLATLQEAAPDAPRLAKSAFSCCGDNGLRAQLDAGEREQVLLCGIEAHVCILATVDDLLRQGRRVVVAADAVASRDPANRDHALATMRQLGAVVVPVESILFRLQRQADSDRFKEISRLVR